MRATSGGSRSLRVRVLATVLAVFAISLAVASFLAYELFLQDGRADADIVLAREQERFGLSISELLRDQQELDPSAAPASALRDAVRRYLQLNPSTESYWTIVTFDDGTRLAAANGPPELEPLFRGEEGQELPTGPLDRRVTLETPAGDVRTTSVPVRIDDEQVATLQIVAPLDPVRQEALEAALLVAAAAGLALLVGGTLLGITLWRSLAPLGALAQAARTTELASFGDRVEVPDTDDEVGQLAREFNTMLDRLEAASAQQREFMASVGHELRTPITIARGHLELLHTADRRDGVDDETLYILGDELSRMGRLVEDLMAIARSEMPDFIRPRQLELVQRLAGNPLTRDVRVLPPPPVLLDADPDRLAQAVLNLVYNARVHTPAGTSVRVTAAVAGTTLVLRVSDDGPGVPEAIRDRLFTPFVRDSEAAGSTGLGLAVVDAVVRAHGGGIDVATGPDGSTFDLRLPCHPLDERHDLVDDVELAAAPAHADTSGDAGQGRPPSPVAPRRHRAP